MKPYLRVLMILLLASGAYAEVALSGSATGTMDLPGPEGGGEVGLGVSADWYRPFSEEVALLTDVVADLRFLPAISVPEEEVAA
jgi:hypothetical protein